MPRKISIGASRPEILYGGEIMIPEQVKQVSEVVWEIPTSYKKGMLVPARIYATKNLMENMDKGVIEQVTNVATLPGIQRFAFCMPDGHIPVV